MPANPNDHEFALSWQGTLASVLVLILLLAAGAAFVFKYKDSPVGRFLLQREVSSRDGWYGDMGDNEFGAVSGTFVAISVVAAWYVGYRVSKRFPSKAPAGKRAVPIWLVALLIAFAALLPVVILIMTQ